MVSVGTFLTSRHATAPIILTPHSRFTVLALRKRTLAEQMAKVARKTNTVQSGPELPPLPPIKLAGIYMKNDSCEASLIVMYFTIRHL